MIYLMPKITKYTNLAILIFPLFLATPIMPSNGALLGSKTSLAQAPSSGTSNPAMQEAQRQRQLQNTAPTEPKMTSDDPDAGIQETTMEELEMQMNTSTSNTPPLKPTSAEMKQNTINRRNEIKQTTPDREVRIGKMKAEVKDRYEAKKQLIENRKAVQQEKIQESLSDVEVKRLETIKEQAANLEARVDKVTEFLYAKLERISKHVEEREEEGFDLNSFKLEVDAIEDKIAAVEAKSTGIGSLYEDMESLSLDEIKTNFQNLKDLSTEIKADFKVIRDDMTSLIGNIG
jgi:hypothetical protein